jgi:16S rRNA (guanine966-N2)-methyltransferase
MRIIAGTAGGLQLESPEGDDVRPTYDRVKEAWFSSLQPRLRGARVLDAFAGSGALGLEARSRGAAEVVCVEQDAEAAALIERNIARTGLDVSLVVGSVPSVLAGLFADREFDIVLLDPPYGIDRDDLAEVTAVGGEVWLEVATRAPTPVWPATLRLERSRRYGATTLHTAVREEPA